MKDELHITILEDGTIKTETDAFSPAHHQSAEEFLAEVTRQAGGAMQRTKRAQRRTHTQHHNHVRQS